MGFSLIKPCFWCKITQSFCTVVDTSLPPPTPTVGQQRLIQQNIFYIFLFFFISGLERPPIAKSPTFLHSLGILSLKLILKKIGVVERFLKAEGWPRNQFNLHKSDILLKKIIRHSILGLEMLTELWSL